MSCEQSDFSFHTTLLTKYDITQNYMDSCSKYCVGEYPNMSMSGLKDQSWFSSAINSGSTSLQNLI